MLKKSFILLSVLAALCLLTVVCSADQWEDIKSAGVIRFGVAPDYYPFVYAMDVDELDGLDIAG